MAKKIPTFKTDKEEAEFWDTHSAVDFLDELLEPKEPVELSNRLMKEIYRKSKKTKISLRVNPEHINLTKILARSKGIPYQTLVQMWIVEGLKRGLRQELK
ncbi:MAG TPA: CopG family antitoxin [Thermodesulfobacteriota bacterium]|nr:CopG family antitoxin [Thermodesulfobacteriota bacterium]